MYVQDGQKGDLIDGVVYMASPDNTDNADLQSWLNALLHEFCNIYRLGKVYGSRVAYKLNNKNSPEPDVSFVAKARSQDIERGYVLGPPDLAVEIVSPDSVFRDYHIKRDLYERFGVKEYWIIDPDEKKAQFLMLKNGRFTEAKVTKHQWRSKVLKGLTIDVRWFWLMERPRNFEILREHYYPEIETGNN
jgi:Uma2 family endonuclease